MNLLVFRCGKEKFGLPVEVVREVKRLTPIVHVPHAPQFVEGVISLRGKMIAMIDLSKRLEIKDAVRDARSRFIVAKARGVIVGLIVDAVDEVVELSEKEIKPTPSLALPINDGYIKQIADLVGGAILILNLEEIVSHEEAFQIQQIKEEAAHAEHQT